MLLTSQHHFSHSPSTYHSLYTTNLYFTRNCNLSLALRPQHHLPILQLKPHLKPHRFSTLTSRADPFNLGAYESDSAVPKHVNTGFDFDSLLSLLEFSCLLSSAIIYVGVAVIAALKKELLAAIGNRVAVWGILVLVVGVLSGAWIRRRQWRRVCKETVKDGLEVNLLERIEKLEEDLRSTATVVRVLSRQLEKLGIRFRVTRKDLKEPITEVIDYYFWQQNLCFWIVL